jgi:hypothetical protein
MSDTEDTSSVVMRLLENKLLAVFSRLSVLFGVPIAIGFGAWMFNTIQDTHSSVIMLTVQMQERTLDRYTGTDAKRDNALLLLMIQTNKADITSLAQRQLTEEQTQLNQKR